MGNKGYFSLLSSRIHFPKHPKPFLFFPSHLVCLKIFTLLGWESYINPLPSCEVKKGTSEQLCSLIPAAVTVVVFPLCVCVHVCVCCVPVLFPPSVPVSSPCFLFIIFISGLALAIGDQENHGFLLANVSHDCGQLVDVAAVEMLRLPQVQDHRGWARFGCKETHVSARDKEKKGGEGRLEEQK